MTSFADRITMGIFAFTAIVAMLGVFVGRRDRTNFVFVSLELAEIQL